MANRTFIDKSYSLVKREVRLYAAVQVGAAGAVTLLKWNYPTLGTGTGPAALARTYSAAPLPTSLPSGAAYPLQYGAGAEGVRSVTRADVGGWVVTLQDAYQRILKVDFTAFATGSGSGIATMDLLNSGGQSAAGFLPTPAFPANSFGLLFRNAAGTIADPTSGITVLLAITLMDATEP